METFDVSRAYGFGLLLDALKEEEEDAVAISDWGIYYLIGGPLIKKYDPDRIFVLFDSDSSGLHWKETFLTSSQRKIKVELKPATKKKIKRAEEVVRSQLKQIFIDYSKPIPIKIHDSKGETLLQSMELAATKGYRVPIRSKVSYTEGSSLKVPQKEWALAVLGEAHLSIWKFGEGLVSIIPQPQKVKVMNWRGIRSSIDVGKLNSVSVSATLSHIAVLLAHGLQKRKQSGDSFIDKFSSLVYGGMVSAGRGQWKPNKGGLFPMDFLYNLIDSNLEISGEIFDLWDKVFQVGNRKGCEDIAVSLSEFIAHPTLDNWERYQRIHLRYLLDEEIKIRAYPEECIKEVMKNVGG
ncbi:MAG TPA: hypothetical protein EYP78_06005 [Candidatus Omnitrophica bacterium]|nr:hypothetical protein [Candidatus Omnitrophota bacterium]